VLAGAALAASVAACGEQVRGGIPEADATALEREIADVERFVASERCEEVDGQLRQVNQRIDNLPTSVSDALQQNLYDGAERLRQVTQEECTALAVPETTEPTEPTTPEQETPTPEEETPATPDDGTGTGDDGGTDGGTDDGTGDGTGDDGGTDGGTETPAPETPTPEQPEGGTPAPEEGTTP